MDVGEKLDSILRDLGGIGKYQILKLLIFSLISFYNGSAAVTYLFTAAQLQHRCEVEQCGEIEDTYLPSWWTIAIPVDDNTGNPESCLTYKPLNDSYCLFDNTSTVKCNDWVYNNENKTTIMSEFEIACEENLWKLTIVGTMNTLGTLFALPILGVISDKYGRKTSLIISLSGATLFGISKAFAPLYEIFITLEFLEAIFMGGVYALSFILIMEFVHPERRELGGTIIAWSFTFGFIWLGILAAFIYQWNMLILAIYTPAALLLLLSIWFIPESIRWLLINGHINKAKQQVINIAEINHVNISEKLQTELSTWDNMKFQENTGDGFVTALLAIIKSKTLFFRTLNCSFCWLSNALVYYGLSFNSVSLTGTNNKYLNFILTSAVDIPSHLCAWFVMIWIGRRYSVCIFLILSGIACISTTFAAETGIYWLHTFLYLTGKFSITISFDIIYVLTAEIFPTNLRSFMLNFCSMVGRIGSILASTTPLLLTTQSSDKLMILFGTVALLSGLLSTLFPETSKRTLPSSVEDAEKIH